jgi:hypothetical protein
MCFKREKKEHEWVYVLDGCQVRVYLAPKVRRALRRATGNRRPLWSE